MEKTSNNGVVKKNTSLKMNYVIYTLFTMFSAGLCILGVLNSVFFDYYFNIDNFAAILSTVVSVYLCYIYRYNIGLFIVTVVIAYANYSVAIGAYIDPSLRPENMYAQFSSETLSIAIISILIFETCMLLFCRKIVTNQHKLDSSNQKYIKYENNTIIAYGAMLVYAMIFFLTFNFGDDGSRGGGSALTEYRIIVFIIGSYYSGNKRIMKILWTMLIGLTSILVFLSGNRIDAITAIISLLILWHSDLLSYKKIVFLLPFAVVAMVAVGMARGGEINIGTLKSAFNSLGKTKLAWDTAIFAYIPSLSIIELSKELLTLDKLELLLGNIEYIFLGSAGNNSVELINYTREYYTHYYGCISPSYFYMWFGYIGSVLFAMLVNAYSAFYQKLPNLDLKGFNEKLKYICSVYFVCNVGRWYLYGPNALLRNMFVCALVYAVVYFANCLIKIH